VSTYPRTGLQRILAGAPTPDLRVTLYDQDGDAANAVGTLVCTITRADGTVVVTNRATAGGSTGRYTCQLTTAEALTLDVLTAVWSIAGVVRATSHHRIVGAYPFTVAQLADRAGMAEDFDQAQLRGERDRITDLVEEYCGPVVPRYDLEQWYSRGTSTHVLEHRPVRVLRSCTVDGDPEPVADLLVDYPSGVVTGDVLFYDECTIGYEAGLDAPPHDLREAMLDAAADRLKREWGTVGPRVRSVSDGMGVTQQFAYAGKNHPTGLDEVDAVIMRYAKPNLGIG
jgi:hypothetical protein